MVVERGDVVTVTYTGSFTNGTIFDSNDPAQGGRTLPFIVTAGRAQVIPGFDQALLGMEEGETKTVTIPAKDAYGTYDSSLVLQLPKEKTLPLVVDIRRDVDVALSQLPEVPEVGTVLETTHFTYNVTGMNSTHLSLFLMNATKDPVMLEGMPWNSTLVKTNATSVTYRHLPAVGGIYLSAEGPYRASIDGQTILLTSTIELGQEYQSSGRTGRVSRITEDNIYLDFNHPLAGNILVFNIRVDDITRTE